MNPKVVIANAFKMNYDKKLDFSVIKGHVEAYDDTTADELLLRIQDANVLVTKEMPVTASMIDRFPGSVTLLVEAGTGYNNIDIEAATKKGITVCNIPAYSSERVAHTAIMMVLQLSSMMQQQIRMLQAKDYRNFTDHLMVPHREVNGKTIGLIGCGGIGTVVMKVARALDMNVLIYKRHPGHNEPGVTYVTLPELLAQSDYVSLHCPLTEETKHIIDAKALKRMKETAFLINTARGALVDEKALIAALVHHDITGAGLDVQEVEPPAMDSPLYTLDNVIITPHMGWKGLETRERLVSIIADNIEQFFNGTPINVVNG